MAEGTKLISSTVRKDGEVYEATVTVKAGAYFGTNPATPRNWNVTVRFSQTEAARMIAEFAQPEAWARCGERCVKKPKDAFFRESGVTPKPEAVSSGRYTATYRIHEDNIVVVEEEAPAAGAAETVETKETAEKRKAEEEAESDTTPSGAPPGSPGGEPLPHTPKPGEEDSQDEKDDPCYDKKNNKMLEGEALGRCREHQIKRGRSGDSGDGGTIPAAVEEITEKEEETAQMHALHQQGFLMRGLGLHNGLLIKGLREHKYKGTKKFSGAWWAMDPPRHDQPPPFKTISAIETDGDLTNPLQIKNLLKAKDKADIFLTLTNTQLSALVPKIRLYRVNYKLPKTTDGIADYTNPPEIDRDNPETEFYFHSHIDADGIGQLTNSRFGRGAGVGIKEFTWADKSTSPGDKGKRFESTLKLHFQSLDDLISSQDARAGDGEEDPPNFLNLVVPPQFRATELNADGKKVLSDDKYNPEFFQIRAIVGWSVPNAKLAHSLKIDDDQVEAIRSAQESFFLQLNRHSFDFAEDGSIELTVEYYATQEGMLDTGALDLFYISEDQVSEKLAGGLEIKAGGKKNLTELEEKKKRHEKNGKIGKAHKVQGQINDLKTKAKKILLAEQHNCLIQILTRESAVRSMRVRPQAVGMFKYDDNDSGGKDLRWRQRTLKGSFEDNLEKFKNAAHDVLICAADAKVINDGAADFSSLEVDVERLTKEKEDNYLEFAEEWDPDPDTSKGECIDLRYFFLGDLIDAACNKLLGDSASVKYKKSMFYKKFGIILGPITYTNPFRTKEVTDEGGAVTEVAMKESLSLADVPISLDLFRLWWMKTVIQPGLPSMTLKQFVEAIVGKLIAPAIGPDAFGEAGKANVGAA